MKAIAIVDLPDDAFEDGTRWIIDDEGSVRYLGDIGWMHYKDIDEIELRPLPELDVENYHHDYDNGYQDGWNACLDEITGDNND